MAKTVKIKVEETGQPDKEITIVIASVIPTAEQWTEILQFEDEHVGGRPKDR